MQQIKSKISTALKLPLRGGLLVFFVFCLFLNLQAQKETWHWYFGNKAGVDFTSGVPVADTNGKMSAGEGVSSISDSAGNLLFYTNGMDVWNKAHTIMDNGTGLMGHQSSTQSSIIVKQPNNDSIYYIFTLDACEPFYPPQTPHKGFKYSIVNTKQNNGLGKVILKNVWLADSSSERITAIQHCNRKDMWIIAAKANSNIYMAYLLSDTGLNILPVISQTGPLSNLNSSFWSCIVGYMKASPNGKKIAVAFCCENRAVTLFDFDNGTGILSNPIPIGFTNLVNLASYSMEFSPNQKYLYINYVGGNYYSKIYQYDISSNNATTIGLSGVEIYNNFIPPNTFTEHSYANQLAFNKKIYISFLGYSYLGVINAPDSAGMACNFVKDGVFLKGKTSSLGLPTFFPGYFKTNPNLTYTQNCLKFTFMPICDSAALDSIRWDFGDITSGISNTSALYSPVHSYSNTGNYTLKVIYYYPCNLSDTVIKSIQVQYPAYTFPQGLINDTITNLCKQLSFTPVCDSAALDSLRWNFGDPVSTSTNISYLLKPLHTFSDTGTYQITLILYSYCRTDTLRKTVHIALPISGVFLGLDTTFCAGENLQLGNVIPCQLPISYLWQNGDNSATFTVTQQGRYWQQVNAGGCLFSDTINVSYLNPPTISLPNDTIICEDSHIDITIPQGNYSLLWNDGKTDFVRSLKEAGLYSVTATNKCGSSTAIINLVLKNCNCYLYFPNAFTPNGNDLNECFGAVYDCEFEFYHFYIYNRWGELLFETNNPTVCWDGTFNKETVTSDVYIWILEYKSIYDKTVIEKKGKVTVIK
ncbi:MAG: gliding motility-associated C-terminal domain-containing protein [Bacteroidales bacterium]